MTEFAVPAEPPLPRRFAIPLAALVLGLVFLAAVPLVDMNRLRLALAAAATLLLTIPLLAAAAAIAPGFVTPRLLVLAHLMQAFWLLLVAALGVPTALSNNPAAPDIATVAVAATLPILLVPIGTILAVLLMRLCTAEPIERGVLDFGKSPALPPFLLVSAAAMLLFWPALEPGTGAAGYTIRWLFYSLSFAPFLAGCAWREHPRVRWIWIAALSVNAGIAALSGSRAHGFLPWALYVLGVMTSIPPASRVRALLLCTLAAVPLFVLSGAIGRGRGEIGRTGVSGLNTARAGAMARSITETLRDRTPGVSDDIGFHGLGRMVAWPNLAVTAMTPSPVPYRGFDSLPGEIAMSAQIAYLSGTSQDDFYRAGLSGGPAAAYGFRVDSGTSVEFGVLADGWSRSGPAAALLFSMALAIGLMAAEAVARRLSSFAGLAVLSACARTSLYSPVYPLLHLMRFLALCLASYALLALVLRLVGPRREGA